MEIEFVDDPPPIKPLKPLKQLKFEWIHSMLISAVNKIISVEEFKDLNDLNNFGILIRFSIRLSSLYSNNNIINSLIISYSTLRKQLTFKTFVHKDIENYVIHIPLEVKVSNYSLNGFDKAHNKLIKNGIKSMYNKISNLRLCGRCLNTIEDENGDCLFCIKRQSLSIFAKYPIGKFNQYKCSICYEKFKKKDCLSVINCGHYFHTECITKCERKNIDTSSSCPMCRKSYTYINVGGKILHYKENVSLNGEENNEEDESDESNESEYNYDNYDDIGESDID